MAKSPYPDITQDPRYRDFVLKFHGDPMRFAVEVTGFRPSLDQEDLFLEIAPLAAKVSVVSGTGTGKTASYGRIALWHMLCHPFAVYEGKVEVGSNTYIGAPLIQQVADGVWKEMQDTRVAIACKPSDSSHSPNSRSVSASICSSLSSRTKPQDGFSFRTIAVATRSCSEPDMLSH